MEDYRLEQSGQEVQNILNGAAMQSDLTAETERATEAEQTLQGNIDIEERDRKAADLTLQGNIDAEELRAKAAEKQNADDIDALEEKVPSGASSSNKLATESYVDDSVATATATFRGTYNLVSDLHLTVDATEQQIATALALAISTVDNNDYCFVQVPTSSETPTEIKEVDRYKFNGTAWSFEYKLNNSGFTTAQWAAINSGITSGDVTKLAALPTNTQLTTLLNGKQDTLTFDSVPTEGSNNPVKSGGVYSAIDDEKTARENADSSLSSAIEAILLLIPSAATSLNKLADKAFVNSSIATASATFRGTYNLVTDLSLTVSATHAQIATALAGAVSDEDNNDYAFVQIPTADATPTQIAKTERYKYNGTAWEYEYDLNNSGYTAAQWAAINSGITEALVTKLSALPTNTELTSALGVLTSSITTINQKIPSAASQANQLVDTAAMESYIVQVLDVLTASFNVTSTDGHVTVSISQVDGKITSVSVSTSDIASAASLSLIAGRVTTAEGNISTNAADIANLQDAYAALTQSALVVVQPTDTWPVASPATSTIYRVVDRVNTPPQNYSDYMWNGTAMVLMAEYDNAIDDVPTADSNNLVKSGGVYKSLSKGKDTNEAVTSAVFWDISYLAGKKCKFKVLTTAASLELTCFVDGTAYGQPLVKDVWCYWLDFSNIQSTSTIRLFYNVNAETTLLWEEISDEIADITKVESGTQASDYTYYTTDYKTIWFRRGLYAHYEVFPVPESGYKGIVPQTSNIFNISGDKYIWKNQNFVRIAVSEDLEGLKEDVEGNLKNVIINKPTGWGYIGTSGELLGIGNPNTNTYLTEPIPVKTGDMVCYIGGWGTVSIESGFYPVWGYDANDNPVTHLNVAFNNDFISGYAEITNPNIKYIRAWGLYYMKTRVVVLRDSAKVKSLYDIIVDVNGAGDTPDLYDAIISAKAIEAYRHSTVFIKAGDYEMDTVTTDPDSDPPLVDYFSANRNISIIGVDKNRVKIFNTKGEYRNAGSGAAPWNDDACLRIAGNVLLKNLKFVSTHEDYSGQDTPSSYCLHLDFAAQDGNVLEIDNCILYNDHAPCLGIGLHAGYTIRIKDSYLHSVYSMDNNWNGAIVCHDGYDAGNQQSIEILNNIIESTSRMAISLSLAYNHGINALLVGNAIFSNTESPVFVSEGVTIDSKTCNNNIVIQ